MSFQPTLAAADRNTGPIWFQELRPASGRGCEPILDTSDPSREARFERDTRLGDFCKSGVGVRHHLLRSYSISICEAILRAHIRTPMLMRMPSRRSVVHEPYRAREFAGPGPPDISRVPNFGDENYIAITIT